MRLGEEVLEEPLQKEEAKGQGTKEEDKEGEEASTEIPEFVKLPVHEHILKKNEGEPGWACEGIAIF